VVWTQIRQVVTIDTLEASITMKSETTRHAALARDSLATAGLGALAAGFAPRVSAAESSPTEKANVQLVNDFCAAWAGHQSTRIMSFFAPTPAPTG
jgi:gamma-glutamylcysteine synthetase